MERRQRKRSVEADVRTTYVWDVFLSHSSIDKRAARILAGQLRQHGLTVWFDEDQIGDINRIVQRVNHGLANSKRLVLLITDSSSGSRWCEAEVDSLLSSQIVSAVNRVVLVHHRPLRDSVVPPLLRDLHRVDIGSAKGVRRLAERLRQPISAEEYCENLRAEPLLKSGLSQVPYQVEPSDFAPVVLGEVAFQYGGPFRAIRTADRPISLNDLSSLLTARGSGRVIVLLGEAGIGKSTLCRLLCRRLVDVKHEKEFLPIYVSLGEWDSREVSLEQVVDRKLGFNTIQALVSDPSFRRRLVFFIDGLNEQDSRGLASVFSFARRMVVSHRAIAVFTTRLVTAANQILPVEDLRFFEVRRWTPEQLEKFFATNHQAELLSQVPIEVRNSLRLPLLASLVLRRMLQEDQPPRLHAVSDVFDYILGQFAQGVSASSKARAIKGGPKVREHLVRDCLRELALRMTRDRVVQSSGLALEECLPRRSRAAFRSVMAHAVNGGMLRCSDSVVALDPEASAKELRKVRIGFLHQSVQEYLAAQRLQDLPGSALPANVSHDAFWRDIPLHLTRCLAGDTAHQRKFVLSFLQSEKPDFLTACRVLQEIKSTLLRSEVQDQATSGLVASMGSAFYYPYSIEAFQALGVAGIETLRNCVGGSDTLGCIYAEAESHVIGLPLEGAMEVQWRRAARAIYMLGELGDIDVLAGLADQVPSIRSRHLLYHIGEALLAVCKRRTLSRAASRDFLEMSRRMCKLPKADAVMKAQALCVSKALGSRPDLRIVTNELAAYLSACAQGDHPNFRQEYWCRAHGVEALAEIGRTEDCVGIFSAINRIEDNADYGADLEGHYRQVQSSILKGVVRSCDAHPGSQHLWRPLLEAMFRSPRVATNDWACRHLESLLLRSFVDDASLGWIRAWKQSGALGGAPIARALANVLWFMS